MYIYIYGTLMEQYIDIYTMTVYYNHSIAYFFLHENECAKTAFNELRGFSNGSIGQSF